MITFNRPYLSGKEIHYIRQAHRRAQLAGDGYFTRKCQRWLEENLGTKKAFLTHSCTSALEMAAILADIGPGDEVIMPSFTFVSTANAFVLRGGVPVFVDIRPDTLNVDEKLIEKAITRKTKAIVPVHYAGVGCEMDTILKIARKHRLLVIEDAAHGVKATYKGKELGSIGDMGALSFHETKNIISGEGGALLVNNPKFIKKAEIIWQKGTDRSRFLRGEVDKYTWKDLGSSFLPSELTAAFLWGQLEKAAIITERRIALWRKYQEGLKELAIENRIMMPKIPEKCLHNAHLFFLIMPTQAIRDAFILKMKQKKIGCVFHYVPLHKSPFGKANCRTFGKLSWTEKLSGRLVRLPLWLGLEKQQLAVINKIIKTCQSINQSW